MGIRITWLLYIFFLFLFFIFYFLFFIFYFLIFFSVFVGDASGAFDTLRDLWKKDRSKRVFYKQSNCIVEYSLQDLQLSVLGLLRDSINDDLIIKNAKGKHQLYVDFHFDHCEDMTAVNMSLRPIIDIGLVEKNVKYPYRSNLLKNGTKPRTIMRWRSGEKEMSKNMFHLFGELIRMLTINYSINGHAKLHLEPGAWRSMSRYIYIYFFLIFIYFFFNF